MRQRRALLAVAAILALCAFVALPVLAPDVSAQSVAPEIDPGQPVSLVADEVVYDSAERTLTASGAVEVFYGTRTLTADRITYSEATGRIAAEGSIVLRDETGATVFAEIADLDAELQDGLVSGAQSMLDRFSKLAAVEAHRVEDRYNILAKAVYSPCEVCEENPTPLWRIRARRVIHDEEAKVVHYENATFDVFGVPVLWTPYFSHPDPTVDRATGFLAPSVSSSTRNYGYGLKTPFYVVIDEQSDITLTPFITTNDGVLGEVDYRRAFRAGSVFFRGTVGRSDFTGESEWHGHVDTEGRFAIPLGLTAGWDVKFASDDDYLRYFDFSGEDRLTSELYVERYERRGFLDVSAVRFQSLRVNEPAGQIPLVVPDFQARRDFADRFTGGTFGVFADAQGLLRNNGEDTGRISLGADWERELILPVGLVLKGFAEVRGDVFFIDDPADADRDDTIARFHPLAGIQARYPLIATNEFQGIGLTHVLEPVVQGVIAPYGGNDEDIPNEDSRITEFDETSLFDRDHFTGFDRVEEGPRFNVGLNYEMLSDIGVRLALSGGRVLRFREADEFSTGSGLDTQQSDWVAAWSASYDPYLSVSQRFRLGDDGLEVTRNESRMTLSVDPVRFDLEYVFLDSDTGADALVDREEITARGRVKLTREWDVNAFMRRDLEQEEFVTLGGGVRFRNECCAITAFLRRNFTDSPNVPASTGFGVTVELFTLGAGGSSFGG